MARGKICTITSRNISSWVCPVGFDGRREISSLSLKTVVVHKSVTSLVMEKNLRKGGLVFSNLGRNSKNYFRVYACCFVNINTVTYFNLFFVSFQATQYVCYDQSAKCYSLILIFFTLCVVHDLIFQRKLSRRRPPQALRPITFTQRFRTTRHLISIQLL